jgi:hypothetical protein
MSEDNNRLRFAPTRWEDLGKTTTRRSSSGQQGTQRPASNPQWQAELQKQDAEIQALSNKLRAGGIGGREAGYLSETLKFMKMRRDDTLAKINSGREIKTTAGDVGREVINAPVRGAVGTVLGGVAGVADYLGFDESAESVRDYRDDFNKKYAAPESASQNTMLRYGGMGGEALGSTVPYLAGGVASVPVRAAVGAMSFGGGVDQQDERVKQLREQGGVVSSGQEMLAETFGGLVGLSELIPVKGLLSRVPNGYGQKVVEMVGQRFASTAVGRAMAQGGKNAIGRVAGSAIEEGVQEAAAGVAQDLIELGVYNPNVEVGQSALQDFALGGFAGGTLRGGREVVGRIRGEDMNGVPATPPQTNTDQELLDALEERAAQGQAFSTPLLEDQSGAALRGMDNISAGGMNYTPEQILDIARNNESNPRIADIMSQPVSDVTKVQQVARILNQEEVSRVEPEAVRRISGMFGGTNSVSSSKQMIADELAKISPAVIAESPTLSSIAKSLESTGKQFVSGLRRAVSNYQPATQQGQAFVARPFVTTQETADGNREIVADGSVVMKQEQTAEEAQRLRETEQSFRMADARQGRYDKATSEGSQREDLRAGAPDPTPQFFLNPEYYGEDLGGIAATIVGAEGGKVNIQYEQQAQDGATQIVSEQVDPSTLFARLVRETPRLSQDLAGDLRKPKAGVGTGMNPRRSVDRTQSRSVVPFQEDAPAPPEQQAQNAQANPQIERAPNVEGNVEGPNEISGPPATPRLQAPEVQTAPTEEAAPTEAEQEPAPKKSAQDDGGKVEKHVENIEDKILNDDRNGIVRYADKVHKEGLIDDADLAEIKRMSKDKDMGAEDIGPELISQLNTKRGDGDSRYSGRTSKRKKRTYATGVATTATQTDTEASPQSDAQAEPKTEERTVRPENTDNNIDDVGRGVTKASDSVARNPTPRKDEAAKRDTKKIDYEAVIEDRLDKIASRGRQGRIVANRLRSIMKQGGYTPKQFHYAFAAGDVMSRVLPKGANVDILFVPSVRATDAKAAAASGLKVGDENTGAYEIYDISRNGMSGLITLSLSEDLGIYARESAAHEAFHVIQDMLEVYDPQAFEMLNNVFEDGMTVKQFDPSILRVLKATDMGNGVSFYDDLVANFGDNPLAFYEAQAVAFGALVNAKESGSPMRGLKATIARVIDMIESFRREFGKLLRNENVISLADYFEGYRSGETQDYLFDDLAAPTKLTKELFGTEASERYSGRVPKNPAVTSSLEHNFNILQNKSFRKGRDLKMFIQERVKSSLSESGINAEDYEAIETFKYLTKMAVKDAEYALQENANAIGWYDEKVSKALAVLSLVHPEIATDRQSKFAFIWALAVSSNGLKVNPNFEIAEKAYRIYKETGKMPTDIGIGTAADAIDGHMKLFNVMMDKLGFDELERLMTTKATVKEIESETGIAVSGEGKSETVFGAAILGPKIGNGFFANLYGHFDQLTMDRWLMRTWGRWTGTLVAVKEQNVEKGRDVLSRLVAALSIEQRSELGSIIGLNVDNADADTIAVAIQKSSIKPANRTKISDIGRGNTAGLEAIVGKQKGRFEQVGLGDEIRKKGNGLAGYLDGQKEAPAGANERKYIRSVFQSTLATLKKKYPKLTTADLQALLWYPEKRLYEAAKTDEVNEGYDDDNAPDYANAAILVAKNAGVSDEQIRQANEAVDARLRSNVSSAGAGRGGAGVSKQYSGRTGRTDQDLATKLRSRFEGTPRVEEGSSTEGNVGRRSGGVLANSVTGRVPVAATYSHSTSVKDLFSENGFDAPDFHELTRGKAAGKLYTRLINDSKQDNRFGASVYVYPENEYQDMRLFVTKDGMSGFALKGDDIVSAFKSPKSADRGVAFSMIRMAVALGGRKLDAFDTVLPSIYSVSGFKAVARMRWNDEFKPDDWNKETFKAFNGGEPDVVFMAYDQNREGLYSPDEGEYTDSYDQAVAAQGGDVQYSGRTNRAVYTPERTEKIISAMAEDGNKSKGWMTFMSPDEFLGLTLSKSGRDLLATMDPTKTRARPLNIEELRQVSEPLFLTVREAGEISEVQRQLGVTSLPWQVMGHEGRHRMAAFKDAGIEQIPVVLMRQNGAAQLEDIANISLAPQRGGRSDQYNSGDTSIDVGEATPINNENADRIRDMMTGEGVRFSGRRAQNTGGVSQSMMDKVVSEEPSVGVFGKFFDKMVGRIGNESRRRAFVRNVVNSKDGTFVLDRRLDAAIRGIDPADGRIPVDGSSVGRMMEMASQSTGVMQGALELGPPVFDGEITTFSDDISGLFDIFAPIGEERASAFQTYAVARREKDLRAMGRVGFTQVTDAEIAETLRNADADFAEVFDAYQVFNGAIIDYAVDTGLLTEELGDTLKSMDYVPYYRAYEQDDGELDVLGPKMQAAMNNPKSALDLKLKGGSTGLGNLYENMIRNTQSIISAARKNLALQEAADAVDALNDLGVDDIGRRVNTPEGECIMRLRVNGKPVYYQIEDPAVWASIASLGPQQMNVVVEAFSKFANVLRTSVTLAPSFMIANLWRGKISTYVTTDAKLTLGIDTFKGMKDAYQNGETTKIIKANTGIGGYAYGMGERDFANEVRRRYRRQEGGGYGFTRDWLDRLKSGLVAAERIGEATELAERVKLYNDIIASGGNPKSAAYEAMNLTNFGRKGAGQGYIGATMNWLIPMIPFLNARIQGLYRIAENQQNEPTIMGLRKKVLLRGMLYTLASSAIYAMFSDDDRWEEETVENKMLYDIMYLGDKTIYLPRPFEVGTIFGSMPIALYDYARDQDGREASDKLVFAFMNTFAMNPIPQGVKPALEASVNYSFFRGGSIDTMADQNLPAGMRYDERTSETAKAVGGAAGVSPKKVDYVLNGYLGTMGAGFISGVDSVLSGVGVIPKKVGGLFGDPYHIGDTIASASGLTRFVKDSDRTTSRFVSDFYELKREADQANRAHKKLIEEGRREEAIEYAEENKFPLQARKQLGQISKDISKVNKDIDKVEVDPKLTPAEKQLKLKPLLRKRKDLARRGYDYARGARIVPSIEEEEEAEE